MNNDQCGLCHGELFESQILYETLSLKKVKMKCKNCSIEFTTVIEKLVK